MQTKPYNLQSPEAVAKEYGGNKQAIARAAQMGMVDPTAAVLAGMFIDRMRSAAIQEQVPRQTVAQQVLTPQAAPAGLGATAPAQQAPAVPMSAAPMPAAPAMAGGGLADLPVDESMFPDEYAGGGIVAFAAGEQVKDPYNYRPFSSPFSQLTDEEQKQLKNASLSEALAYIRKKYLAPIGEYFAGDPLRSAITQPAVKPNLATPAAPAEVYADESTRGSAASILAGGMRNREFSPALAATPEVSPAQAAAAAPAAKPAGLSIEDFRKMQKEFGVTPADQLFAADREANKAAQEKLSQDRETAKSMAFLEAGLGIMGGTSPYALKNIGEGAKGAVSSYAKSVKEIKADEKEYAKIDRDLRKAEEALRRGDMDQYNNLQEKIADRALKLRGVEAQERAALKPSIFQEVSTALRSSDPAVRRSAETYLGAGKTGTLTLDEALKIVKDLPKNAGATPAQLLQQAQELVGLQGGASRYQGFSARPLGQ